MVGLRLRSGPTAVLAWREMDLQLEPDREVRTELAQTILEYLNDWYDAAGEMKAHGEELDAATLASFREPPSETGRSFASILADLDLAGRDGHMHPSGGHLS